VRGLYMAMGPFMYVSVAELSAPAVFCVLIDFVEQAVGYV
jgi:hypothetical protein